MRLGTHVIHLALAVLLAWHVASGWALLPATFVVWVGLLLLSAVLDGIRFGAARAGGAVPTPGLAVKVGTAGERKEAKVFATWPVAGPHVLLPDRDPADDGRREWRRHLADIDICFEERYPREGICTTSKFFIRAGDVLALRYFPVHEEDASGWPCDLVGPHGQYRKFAVGASGETRLPIEQSGVYSIGIGQGESGQVGIWLVVPSAEALSLPVEIAHGSDVRFEATVDGGPRVRIEAEEPLQTRGELPRWRVHRPAASAALLFMTHGSKWDAGPMAMPSLSGWREQFFHARHYFLKLCRGDVLALEYEWMTMEFGQSFDLGDGAASPSSASLEFGKFVRGPSVMHIGDDAVSGTLSAVCPDDGFYLLELELYGPAKWRERPTEDFLRFRLWGEFLQRPGSIRDFDVSEGWVGDSYRQRMPVPRGLVDVQPGGDSQR